MCYNHKVNKYNITNRVSELHLNLLTNQLTYVIVIHSIRMNNFNFYI